MSTAMKIKDLPENQSLDGVRFIYPEDKQKYYWSSQWVKGVWGKKSLSSSAVFPLFCDDLNEALEWEVAEEEKPRARKNKK